MRLCAQPSDRLLDRPRRVDVRPLATQEDFVAGAIVALALEVAGHDVVLLRPAPPSVWADAVATWARDARRSFRVLGPDVDVDPPELRVVAAGGGALLLGDRDLSVGTDAVAVAGLGAEVALTGSAPEAALERVQALAAVGALWGLHWIPRFGTVGRCVVELVEEIQHRAGPAAQSVVADTVRAALFGRAGPVPVNLGVRDRPPHLGVWSSALVLVDPAEL